MEGGTFAKQLYELVKSIKESLNTDGDALNSIFELQAKSPVF